MTMPGSSDAAPERGARRRAKLVRVLVGLGILVPLLLIGLWGWLQYAAKARLDAAIAEGMRLDPGGWTPEAVESRRVPVPDTVNAARLAERVAALVPESWPGAGDFAPTPEQLDDMDAFDRAHAAWEQGPPRGERLQAVVETLLPNERAGDRIAAGIEADLAAVEPAIREARALADSGRGRFSVAYPKVFLETKVPHLDRLKRLSRAITLDAVMRAEHGELEAALEASRVLVGLSRAIGDEPIAVSQMMRLAFDTAAVFAFERTLGQGEPSVEAIRRVALDFEGEQGEPFLRVMIEAERASYDDLFGRLERGELDARALSEGRLEGRPDPLALALFQRAYYRNNRARMLEWSNLALEQARLPLDDALAGWHRVSERIEYRSDSLIESKATGLASLLTPLFDSFAMITARGVAMLRCGRVAAAIEIYRRGHGEWPSSLEELVPGELGALPRDPFLLREPLRMKRLEDGVVVYSVGPEGQDDGGKLDFSRRAMRDVDVGVRLWDPAARHVEGQGERAVDLGAGPDR